MTVSKWIHERPRNYYKKCVEMFGEPTAISNVPGGFALWTKTHGLFSEHILRDEDVRHCVPRPHHDYFQSSVRFYIPPEYLLPVLKISGSINYDGLKKLLTARCGGIGANQATLYLGMLVGTGRLSIAEVKRGDLYPRMIRGEIKPHSELHSEMYQMKLVNNRRYKQELADPFAHQAFDKCYVDPSKAVRKTQKKRAPTKK